MICAISIEEVRHACETSNSNEAARHWFQPAAMRFFRSRVASTAYKAGDFAFFVSSEQYTSFAREHVAPRRYTVRCVHLPTGRMTEPEGQIFQGHANGQSAKAALKRCFLRAGGVWQ